MDLNPEGSLIKRNITNSKITIIPPHDHQVLIKAPRFALENSGNIIYILSTNGIFSTIFYGNRTKILVRVPLENYVLFPQLNST